jgi:hypothetical protein
MYTNAPIPANNEPRVTEKAQSKNRGLPLAQMVILFSSIVRVLRLYIRLQVPILAKATAIARPIQNNVRTDFRFFIL